MEITYATKGRFPTKLGANQHSLSRKSPYPVRKGWPFACDEALAWARGIAAGRCSFGIGFIASPKHQVMPGIADQLVATKAASVLGNVMPASRPVAPSNAQFLCSVRLEVQDEMSPSSISC